MIREIKFVNLFSIGNKLIIKYRCEEGLGFYVDNGEFSIKILYNGNIISPKKIKKIDNKVIRVDYYVNESKKLIMDLINYGMKVIVTCNTLNQEFEIKNIDESKVYTNLYKRITESKKCSDIIDASSKLFLGKEEYKFNSKLRKDKNFRRDVMYTKAYEEEIIDDKIILYESFHGKTMSCNPYAIFKYLLNDYEYKDFKHIWVLNDSNNCKELYKNMNNVEFVKVHSDEYVRYLAKAKYLINNTTFPPYYIRKEGQIYLNTWHGTPIKTLGKLMKGSRGQYKNIQRNLLQTTHLINPNKFTADIMITEHDIDGIYQGKIFDCGYPRIDLTLNSNKYEIKKKLNLKNNKKVILYAPTWRGEVGNVDNEINRFIDDYEYLIKKLGNQYTILLRVHTLVEEYLVKKGYGENIVDNAIDTNELLSVVDILIS
ncbi:CDP-glycerol glycerophosphotransferase family protein, partial [Romboutsia ilealis]